MRITKLMLFAVFGVFSLIVVGCGGGGGGDDAPASTTPTTTSNTAPVANAGADQSVSTGSTVSLNGSGSSDANGDTLTYAWSITNKPAGSSASVSDSTSVAASLIPDVDGSYSVQLVVNDGTVDSVADTMSISTSTAPSGTAIFDTSTFDSTAVYGN